MITFQQLVQNGFAPGTKLQFKQAGYELFHILKISNELIVIRVNGSKYALEHNDAEKANELIRICSVLTDEDYETKIREFWKNHKHPESQLEFLDETESINTET